MKILLPFLFGVFGISLSLTAQNSTVNASHIKAAERLLDNMNMQETLDKSIEATLAAQIAQMPQMKNVEGVMREFFAKYMNYSLLKGEYVNMYTKYYTEKELKKLSKFYQTKLGKKVIETLPELTTESVMLGQSVVQKHMDELQEAIMKKLSEDGDN